MTRKLLLATMLVLAGAAFAGPMHADRAQDGPAIKSIHMMNLPSNAREVDVANMVTDLNEAIADAGYADAGYKLWRISGGQNADHAYLWEGTWPSSSAYDAIHDSEPYKAAMGRHRAIVEGVAADQRFFRYVEVTPEMAGGL
jgi:hypothetical protein